MFLILLLFISRTVHSVNVSTVCAQPYYVDSVTYCRGKLFFQFKSIYLGRYDDKTNNFMFRQVKDKNHLSGCYRGHLLLFTLSDKTFRSLSVKSDESGLRFKNAPFEVLNGTDSFFTLGQKLKVTDCSEKHDCFVHSDENKIVSVDGTTHHHSRISSLYFDTVANKLKLIFRDFDTIFELTEANSTKPVDDIQNLFRCPIEPTDSRDTPVKLCILGAVYCSLVMVVMFCYEESFYSRKARPKSAVDNKTFSVSPT